MKWRGKPAGRVAVFSNPTGSSSASRAKPTYEQESSTNLKKKESMRVKKGRIDNQIVSVGVKLEKNAGEEEKAEDC